MQVPGSKRSSEHAGDEWDPKTQPNLKYASIMIVSEKETVVYCTEGKPDRSVSIMSWNMRSERLRSEPGDNIKKAR